MEEKTIKRKLVFNKIFLIGFCLIYLYLLTFILRVNEGSLISCVFSSGAIKAINVCVAIFVTLMTILVSIYNKISWKKALVPISIFGFYLVYLLIYGLVTHEQSNVIISNIKEIYVMCLLAFVSIFVLPKIVTRNYIIGFLIVLIALATFGCIFFLWYALPQIIKDFWGGYNTLYTRSIFVNKNAFGLIIILSTFATAFLGYLTKRKWIYFTSLFFVPFIIMGIMKTAIITYILFYAILFFKKFVKSKIGVKIAVYSLIGICLIFILLLFLNVFENTMIFGWLQESFNSFIAVSLRTISPRIELIVKSFHGMNYFNIFFGVGFTSGENLLNKYIIDSYFHMCYHENLICGGIMLALIKFALIYILLRKLFQIRKKNSRLFRLLLGVCVSYFIYSFSESVLLFDYSFLAFSFTFLTVTMTFMSEEKTYLAKEKNKDEIKKIAFVTTIYPDEKNKWYGVYLQDLAKNLKSLGYDIEILYITERNKKPFDYEGIKIRPVTYHKSFFHKFMLSVGTRFKFAFRYEIEKQKYDAAIIHFYPVEMQNYIVNTLKEEDVLAIHYLHSRNIFFRVDEKHPIYRKLYLNIFYRFAYQKCDDIICVSECVKKDFLKGLPKYDSNHVHVIYNGASDLYVRSNVNRFMSKDNNFNLLSVGNLISIKGHKYVIESLHKLKLENKNLKYTYTIVGCGSEKEKLQELVKSYNMQDDVIFKDPMSPRNVLQMYRKNDIFVLPSYYEALGCVYLEAMNLGMVTIGCKHQGIGEVVNNPALMLVNEQDEEDLTRTLRELLSNYGDYKEEALSLKSDVKNYTWEHAALNIKLVLDNYRNIK